MVTCIIPMAIIATTMGRCLAPEAALIAATQRQYEPPGEIRRIPLERYMAPFGMEGHALLHCEMRRISEASIEKQGRKSLMVFA